MQTQSHKDVVKNITTASQLEGELQLSQAQHGVAVLDIYNAEWGHCKALSETFRRLFTDAGDLVHLRFFSVECNAVLESLNNPDEAKAQPRQKGMEFSPETLVSYWSKLLEQRQNHSKPYFAFYKEGRMRTHVEGIDTPKICRIVHDLCKQQNAASEYITNADALQFWESHFSAAENEVPAGDFVRAVQATLGSAAAELSSDEVAHITEAVQSSSGGTVSAAHLQSFVGESDTVKDAFLALITTHRSDAASAAVPSAPAQPASPLSAAASEERAVPSSASEPPHLHGEEDEEAAQPDGSARPSNEGDENGDGERPEVEALTAEEEEASPAAPSPTSPHSNSGGEMAAEEQAEEEAEQNRQEEAEEAEQPEHKERDGAWAELGDDDNSARDEEEQQRPAEDAEDGEQAEQEEEGAEQVLTAADAEEIALAVEAAHAEHGDDAWVPHDGEIALKEEVGGAEKERELESNEYPAEAELEEEVVRADPSAMAAQLSAEETSTPPQESEAAAPSSPSAPPPHGDATAAEEQGEEPENQEDDDLAEQPQHPHQQQQQQHDDNEESDPDEGADTDPRYAEELDETAEQEPSHDQSALSPVRGEPVDDSAAQYAEEPEEKPEPQYAEELDDGRELDQSGEAASEQERGDHSEEELDDDPARLEHNAAASSPLHEDEAATPESTNVTAEQDESTINQIFTNRWVTVTDEEMHVWNTVAALPLHYPESTTMMLDLSNDETAAKAALPTAPETFPTLAEYLAAQGVPYADVNMMCIAADQKVGSESLSYGKLSLILMSCDSEVGHGLVPDCEHFLGELSAGTLLQQHPPLAFTALALSASEAYPDEFFYYRLPESAAAAFHELAENDVFILHALTPLSTAAPENGEPALRIVGLPKVIELATTDESDDTMVLSQWYARLRVGERGADGLAVHFVENVCDDDFQEFLGGYIARLIEDENRLDKKQGDVPAETTEEEEEDDEEAGQYDELGDEDAGAEAGGWEEAGDDAQGAEDEM